MVADGTRAFIEACEALLGATLARRCQRAIAMLNLVSQHDWSRSADSVHELLAGALYVARVQANPACVPDDSKSEAPKFASAGGLQGNDTPSFWKDRSPPGTRVRRLPHWCVSPSLRTENPRTHT